MSHPICYYASSPSGTNDAIILAEIEEKFGSWLEVLSLSEKFIWAIALLNEVAKLEELKINYKSFYDIPGINHLLQLSHCNKLALVRALVEYVQQADILPNNYSQFQAERCKTALIEQGVDPVDAQRIAPLLVKDSMTSQEEAIVCAAWKEWLMFTDNKKTI